MVFQPIDIALLLISFVACLYCMVLSRRLRVLQDTKDGLGATITAFSESVASMSVATRGTTTQAKELAAELSGLLLQAREVCQKVESQTVKMEAKHKTAASKIDMAQIELNQLMRNVLEEHKKHVAEIKTLTREQRPIIDYSSNPLGGGDQIKFKGILQTSQQRRTPS